MTDKEFKNFVRETLEKIDTKLDTMNEIVIRHDEKIKSHARSLKLVITTGIGLFATLTGAFITYILK